MAFIAGAGAAAFLAFFIAFMAFGMVMNGKSAIYQQTIAVLEKNDDVVKIA